jgi:hypothetical protein
LTVRMGEVFVIRFTVIQIKYRQPKKPLPLISRIDTDLWILF